MENADGLSRQSWEQDNVKDWESPTTAIMIDAVNDSLCGSSPLQVLDLGAGRPQEYRQVGRGRKLSWQWRYATLK